MFLTFISKDSKVLIAFCALTSFQFPQHTSGQFIPPHSPQLAGKENTTYRILSNCHPKEMIENFILNASIRSYKPQD